MKTLRYVSAFLLIACLLTATVAGASDVYTLEATLIGVDVNDEGIAELTVILVHNDMEVTIGVAEDSVFYAITETEPPMEITFDQFVEYFMYTRIEFDFIVYEDNYLIVEGRNIVVHLM